MEVTTILGGAICGYCETGRLGIDKIPASKINSAITHAKTGRSIKNFAITVGP
jgi:hypothetical protein